MPEAFPPLSPEYDRFLYAVVCHEANGMALTMASAIARSGADPWREAALIAKMPEDVALRVLAALIPEPTGQEAPNFDRPSVARLFALLPARKRLVVPLVRNGASMELIIAVLLITLCAGFVFAQLFAAKPIDSGASAPATEIIR